MPSFKEAVESVGLAIDAAGVIVIVLGVLVAADIIRTVAVAPTLQGVLVLGLIVVIRTFLSMALQVELEGRWPWHRANANTQT